MRLSRALLLLPVAALLPLLSAQKSETSGPRVSLKGTFTVARALQEIRRQTGLSVRDDRKEPDQQVSLDLDRVPFWRAVDALSLAARAKTVQTGPEGTVSLQRLAAEDRRPPVSYDGPFRTRLLRVATTREFDAARGGCTVGLEVTWTPSLRPLFLESHPQKLRLQNGKGAFVPVTDEGSSLVPVDGRYAITLDVNLPALPRADSHIGLLDGTLLAVAPSKMLRFSFDADLLALKQAAPNGAQRRLAQEEVVCRITRVVLTAERWSVQLRLDYPEGNRKLESFQAGNLVVNNELVLRSRDGKRSLFPTSYVIDQVNSSRALVTYHFTDKPGFRRGRPTDWKPSYQAPARIIDLPFRFSFRNVPLP